MNEQTQHSPKCNADNIDALHQRVEELERALRLTLAAAPDAPILLNPLEQEVVNVRDQRDHLQRVIEDIRHVAKEQVQTVARELAETRDRLLALLETVLQQEEPHNGAR